MNVRARSDADREAVEAFLARHNSTRVARLAELLHPIRLPALVAEEEGRLAGLLTYIRKGTECEIFTLDAAERWRGVGTALIEEVERVARREGCTRLIVITTNDNVDALRFYQRRGFRLATLHPGSVDDSRTRLKPEIPTVGSYGIPLRDEIVLEKQL